MTSVVPQIVFATLGAVTAGISCAINGIEASKVQASDKNSLLAASALTGVATIIIIIAFVLLRAYGKAGGSRGLLIAFWVLAIIYGVMILTSGVISGVVGNKLPNQAEKSPLIAAAVLPVFSLIFFIIAYLFSAVKRKNLIIGTVSGRPTFVQRV